MSDQSIAEIGRKLAEALQDFAYTRKSEDKQRVHDLQFHLIKAVKEENNT